MSFSPPLDFYISQWRSLPAAPKGEQLKGKIVILTGANSGIGLEVAHHMTALHPDHLILAVRDPSTATDAFQDIVKRAPKGVKIDLWELNLSSFESVKAFAKRCESLPRVDVLINNAGRNPGFAPLPMKSTVDGHEDIHQVNVLSQVLLVFLLHDLLVKAPAARVVFTSSEVHAWAPTEPIAQSVKEDQSVIGWFEDEKRYITATRYFQSKLLLQMAIRSLIPLVPYTVVSVNPGLCKSNLGRDFKAPTDISGYIVQATLGLLRRKAEVGARNVTSAVVNAQDSYEYWSDCGPHAAPSMFMASKIGMKATEIYWQELVGVLEGVASGSTRSIVG